MTDPRTGPDETFLDDVRRMLDAGALPESVSDRLAAARRAAIAEAVRRPPRVAMPSPWLPVGALATTVLAVAVSVTVTDTRMLPVVDDARALAAAQEVELLEDLEFLAWLDDDAHAG